MRQVLLLVAFSLIINTESMAQSGSDGFGRPPHPKDVQNPGVNPSPSPPPFVPLAGPDTDDVQVSTPSNANQNEMALDVDPTDRTHLVGGANDNRLGDYTCAFYASFDTGQTWAELLFPVPNDRDAAGDPALSFGPNGETYYCALAFDRSLGGSSLYVGQSFDGGLSVNNWVEAVPSPSGAFEDKQFMTTDKTAGLFSNRTYVTWTRFENGFSANPIYVTASDDSINWTTPARLSDSNSCQGSCPAIGPNGEVYVAFFDFQTSEIQVDVSFDGGITWGNDRTVADVDSIGSVPGSNFRSNSFPSLDVDTSGGPYNGRLYCCWADSQGSHVDILCSRSLNGGATWSAPVIVNDDGTDRSQFFPWLDVDSLGNVNIGFYDRRDDPNDRQVTYYVARSSDGGVSFQENRRIGDQAFNPNNYGDGNFLGDYTGVAASDRNVHGLWADGRNNTNDTFTSRAQLDFSGDVDTISAGTGGQLALSLNSGPLYDGAEYRILGSITGTSPGLDFGGGVVLPLNYDPFFILTLTLANTLTFDNFFGNLDASGSANATFDTLGPFDPVLAGLQIDFAAIVRVGNQFVWTSNPYQVTLGL